MNLREIALLSLMASACGNTPNPSVELISLDSTNSRRLPCDIVATPLAGSDVVQLMTYDDAVLVVMQKERRVAVLNDALLPIWQIEFERTGPRGVMTPMSAALIDSIVMIADRQQSRIKRFRRDGTPLSPIDLKFNPVTLANVGGTLLVIPAVIGRYPSSLIYALDGDSVISQQITPAEFANVSVKMIGNFLSVGARSDKALLIHQFLTPRAYLWRPSQPLQALTVPLPRAVKDAVGYVPPLPLDSAALYPALAVGIAAAADPVGDGFLFLTRSGAKKSGSFEKILLRTDSLLNFQEALLLPANMGHLAVLPNHGAAVLVDEEGRWYRCRLK